MSVWIVDNRSWPIEQHDDDLTTEQILDVLDQVGAHYPGAVASLADTAEPTAEGDTNA